MFRGKFERLFKDVGKATAIDAAPPRRGHGKVNRRTCRRSPASVAGVG
jgi:hypothetical protein